MIDQFGFFSIPHTGTRTLRRIFEGGGYTFKEVSSDTMVDHPMHFAHLTSYEFVMLASELSKAMPVVMPFRHPYVAELSYKQRGKSIGQLATMYRWVFNDLWDKVMFIPLDAAPEVRDSCFKQVQTALDVSLLPRWYDPVTEYHNDELRAHEVLSPREDTIKLVDEYKPLLDTYYQ